MYNHNARNSYYEHDNRHVYVMIRLALAVLHLFHDKLQAGKLLSATELI